LRARGSSIDDAQADGRLRGRGRRIVARNFTHQAGPARGKRGRATDVADPEKREMLKRNLRLQDG